ncbi:MAG: LysE family translocator [Streptosporangiales bacterium]|nr:LysE family translocator [Streptosporangiales bacterium]
MPGVVSLQTLMVFVAASVVLVAVPGPNHIYITARSLAEGRRAGIASALGVETGTLVHIAVAAAGLSYLIATSAVAFRVVKYVGAAYLIYLGIRTLLDRGHRQTGGAPRRRNLRRVYIEGVVVNLFNPKVILFFLAFLPQFVDPGTGNVPVQIVLLGLVLLVIGVASDLLYAVGVGSAGDWMRPQLQRYQRYLSGAVYVGLGVMTALVDSGHRRS